MLGLFKVCCLIYGDQAMSIKKIQSRILLAYRILSENF